jgi:hypothetical protein
LFIRIGSPQGVYLKVLLIILVFHTGPISQTLGQTSPSTSYLNVRLSNRVIHPPKDLVKNVIPLKGIRAARARVAPTPQSAILETDNRERVVIISTENDGTLTAYLLEEIALQPHLPILTQCTEQRRCAVDRTPVMGGLGCVALCLKEVIDNIENPLMVP